jgi:hypothetical protein
VPPLLMRVSRRSSADCEVGCGDGGLSSTLLLLLLLSLGFSSGLAGGWDVAAEVLLVAERMEARGESPWPPDGLRARSAMSSSSKVVSPADWIRSFSLMAQLKWLKWLTSFSGECNFFHFTKKKNNKLKKKIKKYQE